jgi:uncharacterized membrane protein YkvA (DUF1232 family)
MRRVNKKLNLEFSVGKIFFIFKGSRHMESKCRYVLVTVLYFVQPIDDMIMLVA